MNAVIDAIVPKFTGAGAAGLAFFVAGQHSGCAGAAAFTKTLNILGFGKGMKAGLVTLACIYGTVDGATVFALHHIGRASERKRLAAEEILDSIDDSPADAGEGDQLRIASQLEEEKRRRVEAEHRIQQAERLSEEYFEEAARKSSLNDELQLQLFQYKAKNEILTNRLNSRAAEGQDEDFVDLVNKVINSPTDKSAELREEIVRRFAQRYGDRIIVTDRAYKSLRDCVTTPILLYKALLQLCKPLYNTWNSPDKGNIDKRYHEAKGYVAGFRAPLDEGKMTHRDNKLNRLRETIWEGKTYIIEPHLAYGNKDDQNGIRIYYAWDEEKRSIIIGHIGRHLDNRTTKKRGK